MTKKCPSCEAELMEGAKFCIKCGANAEIPPSTSTQPQTFQPMARPRNINKKIIAIAIIVSIIIVVAIVLLVILGGNYSFIGKWSVRYTLGGPEIIWTVYDNGSVLQEYDSYSTWGHWEQIGDQVCGYWEPYLYDYRCITIEYSDGGNKIIAYYQGVVFGTATRIG